MSKDVQMTDVSDILEDYCLKGCTECWTTVSYDIFACTVDKKIIRVGNVVIYTMVHSIPLDLFGVMKIQATYMI
jgi:hypothetical protein